jgi:hypothetical protein
MNNTRIGFQMRTIQVLLGDILPVRQIKDPQKTVCRYKAIVVSVSEVGLIEPLVVYPQKDAPGKYLLLDGHLRLCALKELGHDRAECLIANDDECFTYNARVSRVSPIQEHRMIHKAVEMGVKPERISAALNLPVRVVKAYLNLLVGLHPEAVDLLKDKNLSPRSLRMLRKVTGVRQIEIAELMVAANNYSAGYVDALILGTHKEQLVTPEKPKKRKGLSPEDIARMEEQSLILERDLKSIEASYGQNVLILTVVRSYVRKLLSNAAVGQFLQANYSDILGELSAIVEAESL